MHDTNNNSLTHSYHDPMLDTNNNSLTHSYHDPMLDTNNNSFPEYQTSRHKTKNQYLNLVWRLNSLFRDKKLVCVIKVHMNVM